MKILKYIPLEQPVPNSAVLKSSTPVMIDTCPQIEDEHGSEPHFLYEIPLNDAEDRSTWNT